MTVITTRLLAATIAAQIVAQLHTKNTPSLSNHYLGIDPTISALIGLGASS
jgi:hypothetical protein